MPLDTGTFRSFSESAYRCDRCHVLLTAAKGKGGDRCPACESGLMRVVHRITRRMIAENEAG